MNDKMKSMHYHCVIASMNTFRSYAVPAAGIMAAAAEDRDDYRIRRAQPAAPAQAAPTRHQASGTVRLQIRIPQVRSGPRELTSWKDTSYSRVAAL